MLDRLALDRLEAQAVARSWVGIRGPIAFTQRNLE